MPGYPGRQLHSLSRDASGTRHTAAALRLRREPCAARGPTATSARVSHCCNLMRSPFGAGLEAFAGMQRVDLASACCNPTRVAVAVSTLHEVQQYNDLNNSKTAKTKTSWSYKIWLPHCIGGGGSVFLSRRPQDHRPTGTHSSTPAFTHSRRR